MENWQSTASQPNHSKCSWLGRDTDIRKMTATQNGCGPCSLPHCFCLSAVFFFFDIELLVQYVQSPPVLPLAALHSYCNL